MKIQKRLMSSPWDSVVSRGGSCSTGLLFGGGGGGGGGGITVSSTVASNSPILHV